eukprot:4895689-Lingulodinium_polyedra.AAC.1
MEEDDCIVAGEELPRNVVDLKAWVKEKDELERHFFTPEKPAEQEEEMFGKAAARETEAAEAREEKWSLLERQRQFYLQGIGEQLAYLK